MKKQNDTTEPAISSNGVLGAVKKVREYFKLVGLSKPFSMTCRTDKTDIAFWPKVGIPRERFDALWNYCKDNWKDKKIAEIEHEGLRDDGTPINGIVIGVREV